jgi:energy-converting hydrogenase A subunit R
MKLIPQGASLFEVISRYDDLLTMEGREDYEPGDTLALIVPFLLLHGITENNIVELAHKATLTQGARELLTGLRESGWKVFCITTTYAQYARYITGNLGISFEHIACTPFPLDSFSQKLSGEEMDLIKKGEEEILKLSQSIDDRLIKNKLDDFFWVKLPRTPTGKMIRSVKPVGGQRKVQALTRFAIENRQPFSDWVVVADSITDFRMLKTVDQAGGLAIAFNGNQYALPYATMALASTHLSDLNPILNTWRGCGRGGVQKELTQVIGDASGNRNNFDWISGNAAGIYDIIALHRRLRKLVREKAGELG